MINKKYSLGIFIIVVITQLFVPFKMIQDEEAVLLSGKEFKFKTTPVDPNDPFRGRYLVLNFEQDSIHIPENEEWRIGENANVVIHEDENGFARIHSISREVPSNNSFIEATIGFSAFSGTSKYVFIEYPFNRYYMEESKAKKAEELYREAGLDVNKIGYALVSVKKGKSVLKDVLIDGVSLKDLATASKEDSSK